MSLGLMKHEEGKQATRSQQPPEVDPDLAVRLREADDLAERIAGDPEALAEFRRLIFEGLEGEIVECDDDEAWLASLADDIRSRAAARR